MTPIRLVFAVLAIVFFATPIVAGVLGVTAETFENRRFADPPKLSQGWDAFQQTSRFLTDRMPLRAQAVRANTRIWTDLFGADPRYAGQTALAQDEALPFAGAIQDDGAMEIGNERGDLQGSANARTGRKGWLFLDEEFSYACDDSVSNAELLDRWSVLVEAIRATGRSAVMFAAPHKASVYPEHLPEKYPFEDCALKEKNRLWSLLSRAGAKRGVIELRSELLRLKEHAGDELFELRDMHWTTLGAIALVDATLDAIGEGVRLEPNEIVDRGLIPYVGDLDVVSGRGEATMHREYGIERKPAAPMVPGRTLLVCDSFAYKWIRIFKPYFENLHYVSLYHSEAEIADAIQRADRVVVEVNEIFLKAQAADGAKATSLARELKRRSKAAPERKP